MNKPLETENKEQRKMIHCENCRFWVDGYCTLIKREPDDGATCDNALET